MPEQEELRLTVTLVDNASAGLVALRTQTQQFSREFQQLTGGHAAAQMESFKRSQGDLAGKIKDVTNVAVGGERAMLGYIGKFGVAGAAISSFGVLAGTAISSMKAWADKITEVSEKSKLLATDPADFEVMLKQYEKAHLNADDLVQSLESLNKQSAAFADPDSPMFRQLRSLAGPQFLDTFVKFKDAFQAAQGPTAKMRVDLEAVKAVGETAAEDARKQGANQDTINRRRVEAENLLLSILQQSQRVRLLLDRPPLVGATDAQRARQDEMTKNATALSAKFLELRTDMERLFNFWKTGAGGEKGWLSTSLEATTKQAKQLEDELIAIWGTEAQRAELTEKRAREAKERGEPPPPPLPTPGQARIGLAKQAASTALTVGNYLNPLGIASRTATGAIFGHDPFGLKLQEGIDAWFANKPPAQQPPAPRQPLQLPAPPPGHGGPREIHTQPPPEPPQPQPPLPPPPPTEPLKDQLQDNQKQLGENTDQLKRLNDHYAASPAAAEPTPPQPPAQPPAAEPAPSLGSRLKSLLWHPPAAQETPQMFGAAQPERDFGHTDWPTFESKARPSSLIEDARKGVWAPDVPIQPVGTDQQWIDTIMALSSLGGGAMGFLGSAYRGLGLAGAGGRVNPLAEPGATPSLRRPGILDPAHEQLERARTEEIRRQTEKFRDEGPMLRRDDRSELDRRFIDMIKPIQVEGTGTLTAHISAPAGTRVGLAASGLFKKTRLDRQTQMAPASTGPPNPAYSPTLEDFPL